jgi:hypothetical protein
VEVVSTINIPLNAIPVSFWRKRLKPVAFSDRGSLTVSFLLMLLVMAMIGIDQVLDFADMVFHVNGPNFDIVQVRIFQLFTQFWKRMSKFVLEASMWFGTVLGLGIVCLILLANIVCFPDHVESPY